MSDFDGPDPTRSETWGDEWRDHPAWPPPFTIGENVREGGSGSLYVYLGRIQWGSGWRVRVRFLGARHDELQPMHVFRRAS